MALTKLNTSSLPSGSILQVQSVNKVTNQTISGTTFADVMSVSITPTSTNSKILVMCDVNVSGSAASNSSTPSRYSAVKLFRDSTQIAVSTDTNSSQTSVWFSSNQEESDGAGYNMKNSSGTYLDTPSTTSAITYKIQAGNTYATSSVTTINMPSKTNNSSFVHKGTSTLTVMEIAG